MTILTPKHRQALVFTSALVVTISAWIFVKTIWGATDSINITARSSEHRAFRRAGERLIKPYEFPAALSPDGSMLLVKQKTTDAFALAVYKGDRLIATIPTDKNPWELMWDPSGKCISYLVEGAIPGTYVLTLWRIDEKNVTVPQVPQRIAPLSQSGGLQMGARWHTSITIEAIVTSWYFLSVGVL